MGNTSCNHLSFCPNKRETLDKELKQNAVTFMVNNNVTNERGKRTLSFGISPRNIFSQEHALPSRHLVGFLSECQSESENDTERDSLVSVEKNSVGLASYPIADCISYADGEKSDTYAGGPSSVEEVLEDGGLVAHTQLSGTIISDNCGKLSHELDSTVRMRQDAIQVTPIEPPDGNFHTGQRFFLQNSGLEWEMVTLEHWNHWNGTWQVRGEDGISFPAAPIALKNDEEYEFLSRERIFRSRSFKSIVETSPRVVIV